MGFDTDIYFLWLNVSALACTCTACLREPIVPVQFWGHEEFFVPLYLHPRRCPIVTIVSPAGEVKLCTKGSKKIKRESGYVAASEPLIGIPTEETHG
jgi:hypothetical protein